jgi:hypothetical protein
MPGEIGKGTAAVFSAQFRLNALWMAISFVAPSNISQVRGI